MPLLQASLISIFLALMIMTRASCVVAIRMEGWERGISLSMLENTLLSVTVLSFEILSPARTA